MFDYLNLLGALPPNSEDFDEEQGIRTITEYKYNDDGKMVRVRWNDPAKDSFLL